MQLDSHGRHCASRRRVITPLSTYARALHAARFARTFDTNVTLECRARSPHRRRGVREP